MVSNDTHSEIIISSSLPLFSDFDAAKTAFLNSAKVLDEFEK